MKQSQKTKFASIIQAWPSDVVNEVASLLEDVPDTVLKAAIIKKTSHSDEQMLREVFNIININDRKPTHLLRHMKIHLRRKNISESILCHLRLDKLPTTIVQISMPMTDNTPLNKLADIANKNLSYNQRLNALTPKQDNNCSAKDIHLDKALGDLQR